VGHEAVNRSIYFGQFNEQQAKLLSVMSSVFLR